MVARLRQWDRLLNGCLFGRKCGVSERKLEGLSFWVGGSGFCLTGSERTGARLEKQRWGPLEGKTRGWRREKGVCFRLQTREGTSGAILSRVARFPVTESAIKGAGGHTDRPLALWGGSGVVLLEAKGDWLIVGMFVV